MELVYVFLVQQKLLENPQNIYSRQEKHNAIKLFAQNKLDSINNNISQTIQNNILSVYLRHFKRKANITQLRLVLGTELYLV